MNEWFSTAGFMPHGHCYLWTPLLLRTFVVADGLIALSYYSIPLALSYFVSKRKDIPFSWIWVLFAVFIFACGTTHLVSIWTIWRPDYWFDAQVKAFTALASVTTAVMLWPLLPKALRIPSVTVLQGIIDRLEQEIGERKKAEAALAAFNDTLERRVGERTAELSAVNQRLHAEIALTRRAEQKIHTIVEHSPCAIFTVDADGVIEIVNAHAEHIFGYHRTELIGQPIEVLVPGPLNQTHIRDRTAYLACPSARVMGANRELKGRRKNGSMVDIEVGLAPIETAAGSGAMAIVLDITERIRASAKLVQHASELARSNEELNSFAYVVTHDLKSPLRGVDQLAAWITEDLGDRLDPATRNHLRLMRGRIDRMERLLDDLLTYSRVGHGDIDLAEVDTGPLVRDTFTFIGAAPGFVLDVAADMPVFITARVPLEQIFRNLIGNAIKHHDRPSGRIGVGVNAAAEHYEFQVKDDGPGIPSQYHERVFGMFQTLRSRDEVEGSGIGLALVKKIVETYGGSVTLISEGRGTALRFSWPRQIHHREDNEDERKR